MEEKVEVIKNWFGTGSINIFGLPMSGKDTFGTTLAEILGARLLSSGMIIRAMEAETRSHYSEQGNLIPSDVFYEWVLPYFGREDLRGLPLILSSVGRWSGEENAVIENAQAYSHTIRAAGLLNISEADVEQRWHEAHDNGARIGVPGEARKDDSKIEIFKQRCEEFRLKTMPVLQHYKSLGLLLPVNADAPREVVVTNVINALYDFATRPQA